MLSPVYLNIATLTLSSPLPITLASIKSHTRIDFADDDTLLQTYLGAAILWAEGAMHRTIIQRNHIWALRDFPHSGRCDIMLPRGKTQSVTSIAYSSGGSTTTLTGPSSGSPGGTDYQEDLGGDGGAVLLPLRLQSWPAVDSDVPAPVKITFSAGYAAGSIPEALEHAIYFACADMYDLRGTPDFQPAMLAAGGPRFEAREALISPWRLSRWYL